MNRYEIRNKASGLITHSYEADAPLPAHPDWGTPEHEAAVLNPDGSPQLDSQGNPVTETVPATYEVVVTDITTEVALRECWANRAAHYPPVTDFADAMVHANAGDATHLQAYYAACEAVKAQFPKPEVPSGNA